MYYHFNFDRICIKVEVNLKILKREFLSLSTKSLTVLERP